MHTKVATKKQLNQRAIYSSFKAAHHLDKVRALRNDEIIIPTQVQIDLTNKCNHKCVYCFYRCAQDTQLNAEFNINDTLSKGLVFDLLDEFNAIGMPAVQYTGGGEPLCHPEFTAILRKTVETHREFSLVTNGTLITDEHMPYLKRASWIRVSLDAASADTYNKTQSANKNDFYKVSHIIEMLVRECPFTLIGISFVVNPINWREIVDATKMAKDLGVHNIRLSAAYTPKAASLFKERWEEIEALSLRAKKEEREDFKVFNLAIDHIDNLALQHKGYKQCYYQHFTAAVGADGIVYPCCTLKYNSIIPFGSLHKESFRDIWYGQPRWNWLKKNHIKEVCDSWPCWMDNKNRFIEYLVDNHAPHVNFI